MTGQNSPRTVRQNLRVLVPIALFQTAVYVTLNQFQWVPPRALPLTPIDAWFPFWPWTVVPYLVFFLASFPMALLIRTDRVFRQAVWAYFICLGLTVPFFVFWPTVCPRPDVLPAETSWDWTAYRYLTEIDTAACSFPSLHIILPAIVCWAMIAEGRWWGRGYAAAMLVLSLTILTTKQHYIWDWLGGLAIAGIGLWTAGRWPVVGKTRIGRGA